MKPLTRRAARLATAMVVAAWLGAVGVAVQGQGPAQAPTLTEPQLQEARQAYDATDYERARLLLDTVVTRQLGLTSPDAQGMVLAAAYELRGRTLQNLRDIDGARADFRALLVLMPDYPFPLEAGGRALALFEEARATTIGMVEIAVTPSDAEVQVDGRPLNRNLRVPLAEGAHTISAARRAYRPGTVSIVVVPGSSTTVPLTLERTLSSLTFTSEPSEVDVVLDGTARGKTAAAQPFTLDELSIGRHELELKRPCYVSERRTIDVQQPENLHLGTVRLAQAVGTISVRSDAAGAVVFLDDVSRGLAPQQLSECEGTHTVEVRTPRGRDVRRYDLKRGQQEEFTARVRPAFALVAATGGARADAVNAAQTMIVFAPDEKRLAAVAAAQRWPANWLTFDAVGRPIEGATPSAAPDRRVLSTQVARELEAQGVAALTSSAGDSMEMQLALLAAGSARPDVLRWRPDDQESVDAVVRRLNARPSLTGASLGLLAIDVLETPGAIVAAVDSGGNASARSLQPGDVIVSAGGTPVTNVALLRDAVGRLRAGEALVLEVQAQGATRRVELPLDPVPRVLEPLDETVLWNVMAVALASRDLQSAPAIDRAAVHLNLAAARMRLEDLPGALQELDAADSMASALPASVRDRVTATAQYIRALCAERSGSREMAIQAWTRASELPGTLLTDSGGLVKEVATSRLEILRQ